MKISGQRGRTLHDLDLRTAAVLLAVPPPLPQTEWCWNHNGLLFKPVVSIANATFTIGSIFKSSGFEYRLVVDSAFRHFIVRM